jgi:phosphoribosylaminoimidazole (AIR) synthetase
MRKRAKQMLITMTEAVPTRAGFASSAALAGVKLPGGEFAACPDFCKHGHAYLGCKRCALEAEEE